MNDQQRKTLRVRFTRKPSDIQEVKSAAWNSDAELYESEIAETIVLPVAHYDAFCRLMYKDWDWLAGKGGFKNKVRQVLEVTAPERETLYVDPSGYSYARYVGIAVPAPTVAGA
jgi:hypothetical protein